MKHSKWIARTAAPIALCAASLGCADSEDATGTGEQPIADLSPDRRPQIVREKVSEKAPALKRATREEVEAFVSRRYAGNTPPPPTAAELAAVVADTTSPDPERKRQALNDFRDMIYRLPTADARREAMQRLHAAQRTPNRSTESAKVSGSQP